MFTPRITISNHSSTDTDSATSSQSSHMASFTSEEEKEIKVRISIPEDKIKFLREAFPGDFYSIANKFDFVRKASMAAVATLVTMVEHSISRNSDNAADANDLDDSTIAIDIRLTKKSGMVKDILLYSLNELSRKSVKLCDREKFEEADPKLVFAAIQFNFLCNPTKAQELLKMLIYKQISYVLHVDSENGSLLPKKLANNANFQKTYQSGLDDAMSMYVDKAMRIRKQSDKEKIERAKQLEEEKRLTTEKELKEKLEKLHIEQRKKDEQEAREKMLTQMQEEKITVTSTAVNASLNRAKSNASIALVKHPKKSSSQATLKAREIIKPYISPLKKPSIKDPEKKPLRRTTQGKFSVVTSETFFDNKLMVVDSVQEMKMIYKTEKFSTKRKEEKGMLSSTHIVNATLNHSKSNVSIRSTMQPPKTLKTEAAKSHVKKSLHATTLGKHSLLNNGATVDNKMPTEVSRFKRR